ncbi:uncharacterized protein RMCN_3080 [Mycolicibacterium novocastrense]|uniref:Uncharacterized protein n=2 Tax=Mycolicibacterium novocastrense TaxID=59813 RepID=A0ABQ0KK25_MYCNV|nr:uncharacterized protein RMCN_3080 [Mycolicibacterium novocastrense]
MPKRRNAVSVAKGTTDRPGPGVKENIMHLNQKPQTSAGATIASRWYRHASATIFGAALIAMSFGAIAAPAVSQAAFNKGEYDRCATAADKRFMQSAGTAADVATHVDDYKFCCIRSGGVWVGGNSGCVEQAGSAQTAPTPLPGQVATGPGDATLPGTRKD